MKRTLFILICLLIVIADNESGSEQSPEQHFTECAQQCSAMCAKSHQLTLEQCFAQCSATCTKDGEILPKSSRNDETIADNKSAESTLDCLDGDAQPEASNITFDCVTIGNNTYRNVTELWRSRISAKCS